MAAARMPAALNVHAAAPRMANRRPLPCQRTTSQHLRASARASSQPAASSARLGACAGAESRMGTKQQAATIDCSGSSSSSKACRDQGWMWRLARASWGLGEAGSCSQLGVRVGLHPPRALSLPPATPQPHRRHSALRTTPPRPYPLHTARAG